MTPTKKQLTLGLTAAALMGLGLISPDFASAVENVGAVLKAGEGLRQNQTEIQALKVQVTAQAETMKSMKDAQEKAYEQGEDIKDTLNKLMLMQIRRE